MGNKMFLSFALFLVLAFFAVDAEECYAKAVIKTLLRHSECARREGLAVLIGHGYNINLPHANGDFALLGIDPNDIRKGVIMQGISECDCAQSFCLTPDQSERLFEINVDRARKQILALLRSNPGQMPCCDIQNSLTALAFTFGIDFIKRVPDALSFINNDLWQKLGEALLMQNSCNTTRHCTLWAEKIANGCSEVTDYRRCAPPTPLACDFAQKYCCPSKNTCCPRSYDSGHINKAYWCCPHQRATCCPGACCPKQYPVCCGSTKSCCFKDHPICCFPGSSRAYCCPRKTPICQGGRRCGARDPNVEPVLGKVNKANLYYY